MKKPTSLQRIISFFVPVTIENKISSFNKILKVVLFNNKLMLDSDKANYSFGELHKVFQITFKKINLKSFLIKDVLILGFGTGSVASILLNELGLHSNITGIEKDPAVVELFEKYFRHLHKLEQCKIMNQSAADLSDFKNNSFDLVVMDVYQDIVVPAEFETRHFSAEVIRVLKPGGLYIYNKVLADSKQKQNFAPVLYDLETKFINHQNIDIRGINLVFCGFKLTT